MKKSVLSVLLAAVLILVCVLAIPAFADDTNENSTEAVFIAADKTMRHCLCGNKFVSDENGTVSYRGTKADCIGKCKGDLVTWKPHDSRTALPTSGEHWYLAYDGDLTIGLTQTIDTTDPVYLDLNGKTVNAKANAVTPRMYHLSVANASLTIMDSSAEKTGKMVRSGSMNGQGTVVWIQQGTFNLYGGTLDACGVTYTGTGNAAPIDASGELNIYGGTIIGGSSVAGGAIRSLYKVYMSGGTIIGGTATNGGTVYVQGGSFTMTGGTIVGGSAKNGGAVYNAGTFTMTGGTITCGTASGNGGAVALYGGTLTVSEGAKIIGGSATNGGALYMNGGSTKATLNGGSITGGEATNGGVIYFNGNAKFTMNEGSTVSGGKATSGGTFYISNTSSTTLTVNGGEIIGGTASGNGGAIWSDGIVNVNGGTITGGSAADGGAIYNSAGKITVQNSTIAVPDTATVTRGGAIYSAGSGAAVTLNDGSVVRGNDKTTVTNGGAVTLYGGTLTVNAGAEIIGGKAANGGALYMNGGATTATLNGGTITGGTATNGGAIYFNGNARFTMEKGTVSGGTATNGGVFYIVTSGSANTDSTLTVNGGEIIGGSATTNGGAIWSSGIVNVNGGTVTGGILASDGTVNISGNPIIEGSGITVSAGKKITVGKMAEGAIVNITMAADGIFGETAEGFQPEHTGYFHVAGENTEGRSIYYIEGEGLYIGKYGCKICGGAYDKCEEEHLNKDSEKIKWIAWTNNAALPRTNQAAADGFDGKHFYLIGDVTVGSFGSVTTADIELYLDLNGKTVAYSADTANRIYQLNAANGTLTITDTGEDGKFIRSGIVGSTQGSAIWVQNASATLNLYGGTFDFSGVTCTLGAPLDVSGKMNIYGGTIIGGHGANGGAIRIAATSAALNMTGGEIIGGSATTNGGAVYSAGIFTVDGGTITGGTVSGNGGAVALYGGTLTVNAGAKIIGGKATSGGALYMNGGSTKAVLNGGSITGGEATNGGVIFFNGNAKFTMEEGSTVSGGTATNGGTFYISNVTSTTLTVNGGEIIGGTASGNGGAIWSDGIVNVNGGTVTGGTATNGGAVYNTGTVNVNGRAVINGGQATGNGGNVFVNSSATLNITGGKITNGHANDSGGNLAVYSTVNMSGGIIEGGVADTNKNSGNIFQLNGTVTLSGGSIGGGFRVNEGANALILSGSAKVVAVDGPSLSAYNNANVTVNALNEDARIQVTMTGSNPNGQVFATQGEGFAEAMLAKISYDGSPDLHPVLENGKLVWKAPVQIGKVLYGSISDAMTAYGDGSDPIKLVADVFDDVDLNKDIVLDLNGKTLTGNVTGEKLRVIDTTSKDTGAGNNGQIIGTLENVAAATQADGKIYVHTEEGKGSNVHSFHLITLKVTKAYLRPMTKQDEPGLYFKSQIKGDDKAFMYHESWLGSFGSAVRKSAPTEGMDLDKDYAYSSFSGDSLTGEVPGTLVDGMMTANEAGNAVYCQTYVKIADGADGEVFYSNSVNLTLQYMIETADGMWAKLGKAQQAAMKAMYEKWKGSMSGWKLNPEHYNDEGQ